ncbi:hypothetical protein ACHAUT_004567 [Salmonella enterica subsp. enterica serovar Enteritidis]
MSVFIAVGMAVVGL